jgi:multidrug efflux pump subunit AcrA (membrane-fusion protein)
MLRSKIRVASLTAVVLCALFAVYPSIYFLQTNAQEPAKPDGKAYAFWIDPISNNQYYVGVSFPHQDTKLKELQKERLAATRDFAKQVKERVKNGNGTLEDLIEPTRMLLEAELDLCDSDKERIAVLEKILAEAKYTERLAAGFASKGQGRQSTADMAKAERLRFEIALERAKANKDLPQKGAANSEPDAKVKKGNQQKDTTQPAAIQAYESVNLYAKVPGFLKNQTVDIGDRVKRGQVLAVVDAPDLEAQLKRDRAALDQARARVQRAKAKVIGVEADLETAKLAVKQAESAVISAAAAVRFRLLQLERMEDLFKTKSIEVKLLDESKERHEAAVETEQAAKAAVATAKAQVVAGMARIEQVRADAAVEEAGVVVTQANLEKSQVLLSFATISAPFDGIVTQRSFFPGDFIRSANQGGNEPLLTIQRVDKMRMIVAIPDRDVPFVDVGDAVEVEIDALPGKKWAAKVSRIAASVDPKTRTMRIEIDLPNPTGQIRSGMFGRVTIVFEKRNEK